MTQACWNWQKATAFNNIKDESIKLHLYGKKEPRMGRKMGHFTVLGDEPEKIKELAFKTKEMLLS